MRIRDPGIRCLFDPLILDGKKTGFGSGIRDEQPGSYFRQLRNNFWVKILKFFDVEPGPGMEKIRIRDKHPGSATLHVPIMYRCMEMRSNTINLT